VTPGETSGKAFSAIGVIDRPRKPRRQGLTYVRDAGLSSRDLESLLETSADYVDILKLASFAPRLQDRTLVERKVQMCREANVDVAVGGPMLEIACTQGDRAVRGVLAEAKDLGLAHVEVSRGIVILALDDMARLVEAVAQAGMKPIAEVGVAYGIGADDDVQADGRRLARATSACLEAGAWKVLLESEGLTENRRPNEMRWDVVSAFAHAFDLEQLMFEADDPMVWNWYVEQLGPHVNLFVDATRVLRLEASRLGAWAQPTRVVNRVATFGIGATL
jgi:phosphosulfolactate synthase (CoM biosynthesis protein A)